MALRAQTVSDAQDPAFFLFDLGDQLGRGVLGWGEGLGQVAGLVHAGEGLSSLTFGFDGYGPGRMVIVGTKGWIEVEPRFHHPSMITVHRNGVLPRIIEALPQGRGYSHEFAEVTQRIREGLTESPTMPLSDTLEVMRILEECLHQAGIEHHEAAVDLG